ncbi:MAG: hypothetical protein ACLRP3_05580 [Escherichia sp.]
MRHGDVVRVFNVRGQVLAGEWFLIVMHWRGAIHEGASGTIGQRRRARALCKYGNPNVLTIDIGTSQLAQATSAHTTLVKLRSTTEQWSR